ncbi:MAG: PAS domain-containing protein [Steroidobacteraceae bacterium]
MDKQTVRAVIGEAKASPNQLDGHSSPIQLDGHSKGAPDMQRATKNQAEQQGKARDRTQVELDPVGVYSCDASGVITYCSDRAVQLWGRRPEIGDTDERFCGSHKLYRTDGSYMPHDQCPMADVLSGKVMSVHDAEVHIERPDGSRVSAIVNIAPLIDDGGKIVGAINSIYDVADRNYIKP